MMHVAFAADTAYLAHAAAMLHSVLEHTGGQPLTAHFLHAANLPEADRKEFVSVVTEWGARVECHPIVPDRIAGLPAMGRISNVMWLRVLLPELIPHESRVLYLDCDTIVTSDLGPLWRIDLDGYYLAAVSNVFERGMEKRAAAVGLDRPEAYFNSGVLLLNLDAWRRDRCSERILAYARAHAGHLLWPDQDALNHVLADRRLVLHPRWNCQNSLFYFPQARALFGGDAVDQACAAPGILHFEGPGFAKPWHYLCKHPLRREYQRHRAACPWPVPPLEGRNMGNRLLRLVPMRHLPAILSLNFRVNRYVRRCWRKLCRNAA